MWLHTLQGFEDQWDEDGTSSSLERHITDTSIGDGLSVDCVVMTTLPFNNKLSQIGSPFPNDLRVWLSERDLLLEVYDVVERVSWPIGPAVIHETPVPVLRTLLTYAYAIGLFVSRDVECSIRTDATLRYICSGHFPTSQAIRQFRRLHSSSIRNALEELLARLFHRHGADAGSYALSSIGRITGLIDPSLARLEASLRLQLALKADSAEMDH